LPETDAYVLSVDRIVSTCSKEVSKMAGKVTIEVRLLDRRSSYVAKNTKIVLGVCTGTEGSK